MRLNFNVLMNRFKDVTALDALNLLCDTFQAQTAYVAFDGKRVPLVDLYDYVDILMLPASDVCVNFFGGPKPPRWWEGTLLTMLLDHLLYAYSKHNMKPVHEALKVVV